MKVPLEPESLLRLVNLPADSVSFWEELFRADV